MGQPLLSDENRSNFLTSIQEVPLPFVDLVGDFPAQRIGIDWPDVG